MTRGCRILAIAYFFVVNLTLASAGNGQADPAAKAKAEAWRSAVHERRGQLEAASKSQILSALKSRDPALVFAALYLERIGKSRFDEQVLDRVLQRCRRAEVAKAAAYLLANRKSESAREYLENHVRRRGAGDAYVLRLLLKTWPGQFNEFLYERTTVAKGRREVDQVAIEALALIPEDRATSLLSTLTRDWSEDLKRLALAALEIREAAGLPIEPPIKPVPTGLPLHVLLQRQRDKPKPAFVLAPTDKPTEPEPDFGAKKQTHFGNSGRPYAPVKR